MNLPRYFISCDWGTSNFRLRLVETHSLEIIEELKTDQGIKILYSKYERQKELGQKEFFSIYLKNQLQNLTSEHQNYLVISSGMGSANIGLQELPYATMPFAKGGRSLVTQKLALGADQELILISGVKNEAGMMRGEEVQAIGLEDYLGRESGILILPGTHCKHLSHRSGEFFDLKNFMTGELFEILSRKSILANSVEFGKWDSNNTAAFDEGFALGLKGQLSSNLLTVRARHILSNENKKDNYFYLSGLLIGDELSYLNGADENVVLAAPNSVFSLYERALQSVLKNEKVVVLNEQILERALLIGQKKILQLYAK